MPDFISPDTIRAAFAEAMSTMYRAEVPLYGALIELVEAINAEVLARDPALRARLERAGEIGRLGAERHGAIRVGTGAELAWLRRAFAVMGMHPVGYYDLAPAGMPVHSTAFRPVAEAALAACPFRMFTSLLRLDLIEDERLRAKAAAILAKRSILSDAARELIARHEAEGGLAEDDARRFVAELLETFRWHATASVDAATYRELHDAHRLLADIVSFQGPHINHLTPRTLDIDRAQAEMPRRGMTAKTVIEGPPPRRVPILLRQTSFTALEESIRFPGDADGEPGTHRARFGEIEQRGAALTPKGRALYDRLLEDGDAAAFAAFPDDVDTLRREGLAYFRYAPTEAGRRVAIGGSGDDLDAMILAGHATADPIVYEDFLPVSAAGIFRSNLGGEGRRALAARAARDEFEAALGVSVLDPFVLYAAAERRSLDALGMQQPAEQEA